MNRFAMIIESSDVSGMDKLPGAKLDVANWKSFLRSNIGGAWSENEMLVLNKPYKSTVVSLLAEHVDDYVFLTYSGHGGEDAFTHVVNICLNDYERRVAVDDIMPTRFGAAIFDCCRCLDRSGLPIDAVCLDSVEHFSNKMAAANERCMSFIIAEKSSVSICQAHRELFLEVLNLKTRSKYANLTPVKMYACARNESAADEDEKAGGYYTTFLIESAKAWGRSADGTNHVYSTKDAHDDACVRMRRKNPQQHPEYIPTCQAYPFAVRA